MFKVKLEFEKKKVIDGILLNLLGAVKIWKTVKLIHLYTENLQNINTENYVFRKTLAILTT